MATRYADKITECQKRLNELKSYSTSLPDWAKRIGKSKSTEKMLGNWEELSIVTSLCRPKCKDLAKQFSKLTVQAALRPPVGCNAAFLRPWAQAKTRFTPNNEHYFIASTNRSSMAEFTRRVAELANGPVAISRIANIPWRVGERLEKVHGHQSYVGNSLIIAAIICLKQRKHPSQKRAIIEKSNFLSKLLNASNVAISKLPFFPHSCGLQMISLVDQ